LSLGPPKRKTVNAEDLLKKEFPAIKWAVAGLIPEGPPSSPGGRRWANPGSPCTTLARIREKRRRDIDVYEEG
jgi:hypothetical protein